MTDYTITTNFGAKDSLPSGNAAKVIKGSEFTTEFTNIATAVNSKADTAGDTFTGVVNFSADVAFDTDTLFVDVSTDRVGMGTTTPEGNLHISAGTTGDATLILEADTDNNEGGENDNPKLQLRQDGNLVVGEMYLEGEPDQTATGSAVNSLLIDAKNSAGTNPIQFATGGTTEGSLTNSTVKMTITDAGNVGIGTTNPTHPLMVQRADDTLGSASISLHPQYESGGGSYIRWGGTAAASTMLRFLGTGDVERMRIDGSGYVLIGTTDTIPHNNNASGTASDGISISQDGLFSAARYGGTCMVLNRMANDGSVLNFHNRGVLEGYINTTQSGVSLVQSSDQRLKENITDSGDSGSTIDAIQVRQFDWIANGKHQDYGFVAQELANAVPDAVFTGEDEDETMGVDYSKLVPILVKEVQALRSRVAQLEESE